MRCSDTGLIVLQAVQTVPSQGNETGGRILYFDGSCPLCSAEVQYHASQERGDQLRCVDVSAKDADLGSGIACDDAMRPSRAREPDGTSLSGSLALWSNP